MKNFSMRLLSIVLSFLLCFSAFLGITIPAYADNVDYVYAEGKYIKNWGVREETATFLSQNAEACYLNNDTSLAELAVFSGSSSTSAVPSSTLYKELQDLMKSNHKKITSYDETRYLFQYTDCQNSGKTSNKISSFYSGKEIGPAWDSGSTWNREHTWPNSKGEGSGENDIMMLRPTAKSENGSRGNTAYGVSSGYYNPNSASGEKHDLRGDVARIMLYQHVRWGQSKLFGSSGVIENKDVLLDWIEEDPVDTWELGRNDSVESITGTRNVFVDYPELAFLLFGEEVPSDYVSPSGAASDMPNIDTPNDDTSNDDTTTDDTTTGTVVDVPTVDTAYKFGMVQENISSTDVYYIDGTMDGYYMATTTDVTTAMDVYLEETDGGYYLYSTDEKGTKYYINMVVSGTHVNGQYGAATATTVYTYDTDSKTIIAYIGGVEYWFGTRNDKTYTSVGPCKTDYNGFYCRFYGENFDTPEPPVEDEPSTGNTLTIPEAIEIGVSKDHNTYTDDKYYVTGTVKEVYNPQYGNMYIVDEDGNELHLYGTWSADGETRYDALEEKPIAGDIITVYGIIGQYNEIPQMKDGWIVEHIKGGGQAPVAPETAQEILADAENLAQGSTLPYIATLTGTVVSIDTAYSAQYGNITLTIEVEDTSGKTIQCFRMVGEGADTIAVGDKITVTGYITNYKGTIQYAAGATFVFVNDETGGDDTNDDIIPDEPHFTVGDINGDSNINNKDLGLLMQYLNAWDVEIVLSAADVNCDGNVNNKDYGLLMQYLNGWDVDLGENSSSGTSSTELKIVTDQDKILKDAFSLGKNETTPYIAQLTGRVLSINKEYNEEYGSICVTINVADKSIVCYNMKGTGVDKIKVGDTITVRGVIKNFYYDDSTVGIIEFTWDPNSQTEVVMISYVSNSVVEKNPSIVDNPVVGTAYKFGFYQESLDCTYFAVGGMKGYYMATTTSAAAAIDVYLEDANGGYYLYTIENGAKKYLNIELNGTHVNAIYRNTPGAVFTYDTTLKTLVATITKDGITKQYAFGTHSSYYTIGTAQTTTYGYFCHFYK